MKHSDPEQLLREAAGPAPWYIRAFPPNFEGFAWEDFTDISDIGAMVLRKIDNGGIVAIVGMYCYVSAIDGERFLIWHQPYDSEKGKSCDHITFLLGSVGRLEVLSDAARELDRMKRDEVSVVLKDESAVTFDLSAALEPGSHEVQFPPALKFTDELLLWGHSTCKDFQPQFGKNGDLCLFVLRPKSNTVEIVPQDWFNNSDTLDLGYQWATRVARDPGSRRVFGDGIRLAPFVLDDSLGNVAEWFGAWHS